MFCNKCGKEIKEGSLFCSFCGAKVEEEIGPACAAAEEETADKISTGDTAADATTAELPETKKKITFSDKAVKIIKYALLGAMIAGILGVAIFIGVVLVGIIGYDGVYLFGDRTTKIFITISLILMIIGLCGIIAKVVFAFVFKLNTFPTAIYKRVLIIALAVCCLGLSVWGFVDCGINSKPKTSSSSYSYSSTGSSTSNTVSAYLGLSLKVTSIKHKASSNYTYVYCSVTNVSSKYGAATMYRYVKVKAVFKNKSGTIVDTDWTYAIDSTWLNSGETKTFYYMVKDTTVKSATLSIIS